MATLDPGHQHDSWTIQIGFINGSLASVRYICGSNLGYERETIDIFGGGRSAHLEGFRRLTLRTGGRKKVIRRLQPELGQKAMLEAVAAQFQRRPGATNMSDAFILSARALLAAHRSITDKRVITLEPVFPFRIKMPMSNQVSGIESPDANP